MHVTNAIIKQSKFERYKEVKIMIFIMQYTQMIDDTMILLWVECIQVFIR